MRNSCWIAAVAVVAALSAGVATAQSKRERIDTLEDRMATVERKLENQGLLELARQIEAQGAEIRRLRGEIERLQHELERARAQQRDQYVDLDTRLKAAEGALTAPPAADSSAGPEADYQASISLLREGRYDEAAAGLQDFLARYRDHELASNALYWLGEAHYVRRDYPAALAAFDGVLRDYPGARKAPDALLKAGYCQYELKRYDQARATLRRVAQEYSGTPAASGATLRLERLAAEGR
ncbi:MAG TPA: tol-pal system protein YbgF [Steroidobacteraceae bacterium]|nr:tol-pal system protein YbgF [Steroidobacteraceae bacterium]